MPNCVQCGHEVSPAAQRCPACGAAREPDPSVSRGKRVIPWLFVGLGCGVAAIAIAGIVAAILIPNFLDALQKAKQKRTMADLRDLGTAIESYRIDHDGRLPDGSTIDEVVSALDPEYAAGLARTDAWENPLVYACWTEDLAEASAAGGCDTYRLISAGRDGELDPPDATAYENGTFAVTDYDRDLVLADGYFIRYPGPGS